MDIVRYIHAADLHLDTPFLGLAREAAQSGHLSRIMQDATFTALEPSASGCTLPSIATKPFNGPVTIHRQARSWLQRSVTSKRG